MHYSASCIIQLPASYQSRPFPSAPSPGTRRQTPEETDKKESLTSSLTSGTHLEKKAASYSPALHCSTIGAGGLNFSVRNGKRWNPAAITTSIWLFDGLGTRTKH